jgi:DNA gyrase subunit A
MATNMAPHNLTEVIEGIAAYIDNRDITVEELMQYVKAPDFPTGGTIYGYEGVKSAFETGRGRVVLRAKTKIEQFENGRERIIVYEIPYQVNKAEMIKKTAALINEKKIEGITDIRDESDREGYRVVYELRRDAITNVVLNNLYKHTELQTSFSVNNIALVDGRPVVLNLKDLIVNFVKHRHDVVVRRTKYELDQAEKRAHVLEGYLIALDHLDEVIKLIRNSNTPEIAKDGLMESFQLSEIQAKAVLALRLSTLTGMERDKIKEEYDELMKLIAHLKNILSDETMRFDIIKTELQEVKDKYGDERRTDIIYQGSNFRMEDMIADEDVVITISHMGYIKRTAATEYRQQARGGKGSKGARTRDEDFVEQIFIASTHNYMLFFTEQGKCFWMKVYEIPEGSKDSKGRAIQNLIQIAPDDKIRAFINVTDLTEEGKFIVMCTNKGTIKKTKLEAYSRPRQNGINAITVRDGETLLEARLTDGKADILMALRSGKCIRFPEAKARPMGRNASGVRGVSLASPTDEVVGMICISDHTHNVLVVSENGYGKRSELEDYRITNRGGKGVKTISVTDKTGALIALKEVTNEDDLMIITRNGIIIRLAVADMRVMGRATQGVRLIKLGGKDAIAAVTTVESDPEEEHVAIDGEVLEGPVVDDVEIDEPELDDDADVEGEEGDEAEPETEE